MGAAVSEVAVEAAMRQLAAEIERLQLLYAQAAGNLAVAEKQIAALDKAPDR